MPQDYPGKAVPATNDKPSNASRTNLTPRYCNHIHNLRTLMGPTVTPTSTEQPAHPPLHPFLGHHLAAVPTILSLQATAVDTYASRAFAPCPMVTQRCIMNMGLDGRRLFADFDHHRSVACLLWPLISLRPAACFTYHLNEWTSRICFVSTNSLIWPVTSN